MVNEGWVNGIDYGWGCFYCGISLLTVLKSPLSHKILSNGETYLVCELHGKQAPEIMEKQRK